MALGQGEIAGRWGSQQGSWSPCGHGLRHGMSPVLMLQCLPGADIANKQKQGYETKHVWSASVQ